MSSQGNIKQLGEQLHLRLLAGSSLTVTSEIAELFLPLLIKSLAGEFKTVRDPHLIDTAAEDALIYYFDHSTKFDPARASLFTYLRVLAKSSLLNSLGGQKNSEGRKTIVEVSDPEAVNTVAAQGEPDAEAALISLDVREKIMRQVEKFIADPMDLRVAGLMVAGIRDTSEYATVMGILDRPVIEQRKLVKRAKDRVKKIFERKIKARRPQ
jgi:DNA-directed RNA polymerase specialized sigma24 family protein